MFRKYAARSLPTLALVATLGALALPQTAAADPHIVKVHDTRHGPYTKYGQNTRHGRYAVARPAPACRTVITYGRRGEDRTIVCDVPRGPDHRNGRYAHDRYAHDRYAHDRYADDRHGDHDRAYRRPHDRDDDRPAYRRYLHWQDAAPWNHTRAYPAARTATVAPNSCQAGLAGGALGGVAGAILGSSVGNGDGRLVATAAGALIGALAGINIGDSLDRDCVANTLEYVPDGQSVRWQPPAGPSPATPVQTWQITPRATWQDEDGRYCREYTGTATIGGEPQQIYGRACRQPDGSWEIVS